MRLLPRVLLAIALASLASVAGGPARAEEATSVSVQGGWWNLEGEVKLRWGGYVAIGGPYLLLFFPESGGKWTIPLGARVGYQHSLSPRWKARLAAHFAGAVSSENPCGYCYSTHLRSYQLFEVGLRYEAPSGWVAGLDVPILAFKNGHELYRGNMGRLRSYPGPYFTQIYFGYAWRF